MVFGFLSCIKSETRHCEKIKCRYDQINTSALDEFSISSENIEDAQPYGNHYDEKKIQMSYYCNFYISSQTLNQMDFEKMFDCSAIDLSENRIDYVERKFFESVQLIEVLNLNNNNIIFLPENIFDDLLYLKKLMMKQNFLKCLNHDLFNFNVRLEYVDFSHNKLKVISPTLFDFTTNLKKASFDDNLCISSSYPQVQLDVLIAQVAEQCSEMKLLLHIINLLKFKRLILRHEINSSKAAENVTMTTILPTTQNGQLNLNNITSSLTTPRTEKAESEIDTIMIGLFWLIIPIILILFLILILISFAIYNKYFKYSLNYPRNR